MRQKSPVFIAVTTLALVALDCNSLGDAAQQLAGMAVGAGRGLQAQLAAGATPADGSKAATAPGAASPPPSPPTLQAVAPVEAPDEPDEAAGPDWGEIPAPPDEERAAEEGDVAPAESDADDGNAVDGDEAPDDAADDDATADDATADDATADDQDADPPAGDPIVGSIARETWVFAEPRWRSRRLGYLRAGAVVSRQPEPTSRRSCKRGWYRIEPRGYVCAGSTATLDPNHPVIALASKKPDLAGLPYLYAMSRYPTPPMYARLPSDKQQQRVEPSLDYLKRKYERLSRNPDFVPPPDPDPIPPLLDGGQVLPGLGGVVRGSDRVLLGQARVRSGFALVGTYEHEGRRFGLTTELALLPLDRMRVVAPSTMRGVHLSDEFSLPLAIVSSRFARRYRPQPDSGALAADAEVVPWRSAWSLSGEVRRHRGEDYVELRDGSWLRADQVVRVHSFNTAPRWARQGKKWIDVSILRQTLVAYEGERPVFTTLVSTGADGLGDPEKTHSTIQGTFLIHTKHLSVTMDGDDRGDEFDLRDVPYVQYFTEGYALHGAYWHDDFGRPRSHGCVNLAPSDAAWLFRWTDPEVPKGWHAALSLKKGTVVYIHP